VLIGQAVQVDVPFVSEYCPGGQSMQWVDAPFFWYFPGLQAVQIDNVVL
jgi:hypothetical protein